MGFLLVGTIWFWIICFIATVIIVFATEKGSSWGAGITLLITLGLFFFFGNKVPLMHMFSYIIKHPIYTLALIAGYFILGTCWAIIKWYFFLLKERDKELSYRYRNSIEIPKVSYHKSEIMAWMSYWPFSAVWTILDRPVKRIFQIIYANIKNRMQLMADKVFEPLTKNN